MNDRGLVCKDGVELDLRTVFQVAGRHLRLLLCAAVLGTVLAAVAVYFVVPTQYQSSVLFYVTNSGIDAEVSSSVSSGDLSTSRNLVDSYIVILKTREALLDVLRQAGVDVPYLELEDMISASAVNKTEFFRVTVTGPDPYQAEKIANAIGEVLPGRISAIIEGTTARVVEPAVAAWKPISPGYGQYALLGFLGGLFGSLGILLLQELAEGPVWNMEDIHRACPYPVLTCMPRKGRRRREGIPLTGEGPACDRICAKLRLSFADDNPCRILGISGVAGEEGNGVTAVNLARALSRQGKNVLLLDGNLAHPTLEKLVPLEPAEGLSEFLAGQCSVENLLCHDKEQKTMMIVPAGEVPPEPIELLGSARMRSFLDMQRKNYDYILLNLGTVAAAQALGSSMDGLLLTVCWGKTTRRDLKAASRTLETEKIRVLGILGIGLKEGST